MRKFILAAIVLLPTISFAQLVASFHQSNIPFVGVGYEFKNKLRPEVRLGVDRYLDEMSVEGLLMYDILRKDDYQFYIGAGLQLDLSETSGGIVIPLGINVYPLANKQFGVHIELAPIVGGEDNILRGSWGIRYRFKKK